MTNPYLQSEANSHANLPKGRSHGTKKPRLNHSKLPALILTFLEGSTAKDAAESLGLSRSVINRFIKSLRSPPYDCLYISHYEKTARHPAPVYILGVHKDATPPKKLTPAQRSKKWREKQRDLKILSALHATPSTQENTQE